MAVKFRVFGIPVVCGIVGGIRHLARLTTLKSSLASIGAVGVCLTSGCVKGDVADARLRNEVREHAADLGPVYFHLCLGDRVEVGELAGLSTPNISYEEFTSFYEPFELAGCISIQRSDDSAVPGQGIYRISLVSRRIERLIPLAGGRDAMYVAIQAGKKEVSRIIEARRSETGQSTTVYYAWAVELVPPLSDACRAYPGICDYLTHQPFITLSPEANGVILAKGLARLNSLEGEDSIVLDTEFVASDGPVR